MRRRVPELLAALLLLCCVFGLALAQLAAATAPLRGLGGAAEAFPTSSADTAAWDALARELHPQVIRGSSCGQLRSTRKIGRAHV